MKRNLLLTAAIAICATGIVLTAQDRNGYSKGDMAERDEINRSLRLAPGSSVEISGINGPVDVETVDSDAAEIRIVRTARTREDLAFRLISIEQSSGRLVIRGEKDGDDQYRSKNVQVSHQVSVRLPRQMSLKVAGVNGRTTIGNVDGPVHVSGINGAVRVGSATSTTDISGINGSVTMTLDRIAETGLRLDGINGAVDLRFRNLDNADLHVTGHNGTVHSRIPNTQVLEKRENKLYTARIGAGGPQIVVTGVNGGILLSKDGYED